MEAWRSIVDFPQYYVAGKMLASGESAQIYDERRIGEKEHEFFPRLKPGPVRYCYPPFSLPLFLPLTIFPAQIAHYLWTALSVVAFGLSAILLQKTFDIRWDKLFWLLVALPLMGPFCQSIIMGQPSFFFLLGFAGAIYALKNERPVLFALCMVAFIPKPHLAMPICAYLIGVRRFKPVLLLIAVGTLFLITTLVHPGPEAYNNYFAFMKYANVHPEIMNLHGCVTLRSQLLRFFPDAYQAISAISIAVFAAGLIFLGWLGYRHRQRSNWLEIGTLVTMPVGFVTSLYVQPYDLVLLLPSICVFGYVLQNRRPTGITMIVLCAAMAIEFFFLVYVPTYFSKSAFYPLFWAVVVYAVITVRNTLYKDAP